MLSALYAIREPPAIRSELRVFNMGFLLRSRFIENRWSRPDPNRFMEKLNASPLPAALDRQTDSRRLCRERRDGRLLVAHRRD
jgi:hypothetical protein